MIGIHNKKQQLGLKFNSLKKSIEYSKNILGATTSQIFTHNPRSSKLIKLNYTELINLNIPISVHGCYIINNVWSINNSNYKNKTKIIKLFLSEMKSAYNLNTNLVIHWPKKTLDEIYETMNILCILMKKNKLTNKIILEIPSVKQENNKTYHNPKDFNLLANKLKKFNKYFVFCLDSAHLFSSGVHIESAEDVNKYLNKLNKYTISKIKYFHLNGCKTKFGSGKDTHSLAFNNDDNIWNIYKNDKKKSGFYLFAKFCKKNNINIILEINDNPPIDDIKNIISYIKKI